MINVASVKKKMEDDSETDPLSKERQLYTDLIEKEFHHHNTIFNNLPQEQPKICEDKPQVETQSETYEHFLNKDGESKLTDIDLLNGQFPFYGCAVCNISYLELKDLDHHVVVHKDRVTSWDLRVKALQQKRKLKKAKKLKIEVKTERDDNKTDSERSLERIFKCAACFKQFSLSYYLKLHVRSHTGEKPYQCAECGLSFITASKLGRHRKLHSSVRFECRICHKLFSRFDTLTKHFDKKHLDQKLDGEPYDYNVILPYLKELEEQLEKKRNPEIKTDEFIDNLWPLGGEEVKPVLPVIKEESHNLPQWDLEVEKEKVQVKIEKRIRENESDFYNESVKDEGISDDEDYFPIDTWTTPELPEIPAEDVKPKQTKEKRKRRKKTTQKVVKVPTSVLPEDIDENPLRCTICSKVIRSVSYLRIHMRTHTGEKPFKCYLCHKGFITSSKMHRHVLTHMDDSWTDEQKKSVKSEDVTVKIEPEWINVDSEQNGICLEKKPTKRRRKRNLIPKHLIDEVPIELQPKKRKVRPHACDFCQKRFLHLETLQVHRRTHKGETKVICCHYCLTEFDSNEELESHTLSHTGPSPYLCTICGKKYKRKESMVYHRRMHKMEKKYQCDVCSKTFIAPCKLQRHLVSHRPDKFVLRYECPVCAHIFNTKYHIEMHLTTHEKDGLIQKENRGQVLAMVLQNARKIPMQSDSPHNNLKDLLPSDERSRICNICGEIFHHFYYLEEHLKTHGSKFNVETLNDPMRTKLEEAEKRYKCEVCSKSFKLHYYLKLHSFTHTKEKPFVCQQCGKGFITKGKLKRHLESHSGLKKYQCHICYKYFTRPSYLRIHVKTIHGKCQEYRLPGDGYSIGVQFVG